VAEGIVKRHSRRCPIHDGKRCRCDGGWEAWVYLSRERRKVRKTFERESEAKSWRAEAQAAAVKGGLRPVAYDKRTLYEALLDFVAGMEAGAVRPRGRERYKPNTIRSYERAIRLHLRDSGLGRLRPPEIRRSDVQAFVDDLLARMSPRTASNAINPLQAFFRREIKEERLTNNPTKGIDLPVGKSQRPRRVVSPTEAVALLAALPVEDRAIWTTAFYAGLRRGELQALRCIDIDLGTSLIHVRKGWDQARGRDRAEVGGGSAHDPGAGDPARLLGRASAQNRKDRQGSDLRTLGESAVLRRDD
jgi:integrase